MLIKVATVRGTYTGKIIRFTAIPPAITLRTASGDLFILEKDIAYLDVISNTEIVTADGVKPHYMSDIQIK